MTNEEVIEELKKIRPTLDNTFNFSSERKQEAIDLAIKALDVRPKGKWRSSSGEYLCDKCFHHFVKTSNFCPNCGDDKRGE